ncbi:MAG: glycoside hydrolase family 27 protein [Umezawaea sp.]
MRRFLGTAVSLAATAGLLVTPAAAPADTPIDNGLARTPQLGWNDWNTFGCAVTDTLIRETADALVSSGMAAAGYEYVTVDDCWSQLTRNADGDLVPDPVKFPHGMGALADYVHGKGLKIGIYSSAGVKTCAGYPASLDHERRDAALWASWGVDYLKYDNCGNTEGRPGRERFTAMRDALAATGRPILFALCNWGIDDVRSWGPATGNSWRTTGDITDSWASVMAILDAQPDWASRSRPGGWNDPDMLEVGNGLTDTEARAHFSLWALLNAPLIAGNDVRTMTAATRSILTNAEVIAVDQDWGGSQGTKIGDLGDQEVWRKPMSDGSVAVVLLNRADSDATVSTTARALGLDSAPAYAVRDLWARTTGSSDGTVSAVVPAHGAVMVVVSTED